MIRPLHSTRNRVLLSTALVPVTFALAPTPALADCLPNASGTTITCTTSDPDGYNGSAISGLTINVDSTAASVNGTLSAGANSAVNNEGDIDVAGTAIAVGGGSTVSNASTATGIIAGDITFAATTDTQVNTLNNFNATAGGITGDITAAGTFVVNNTGDIVGNITSSGNTTINNDDTGSITGDIDLGAGNDTIVTTGIIDGNIDMGAGTNTIGFGSNAALPTGTLTADAAGLNTINLFGTGDDILDIAVTNFDVLNKNGTGSWELSQAVTLDDVININDGTLITGDADFLGDNTIVNNATLNFTGDAAGTFSGSISGAGEVTVTTGAAVTTFSGTNTYTGGTSISAGTLRVTGGAALADGGEVALSGTGTLDVAATETIGALTGAAGTVTLSGGNLVINSGDFDGVISGANGIEKIGAGTLVLSGANTFAGTATVTNGTLSLDDGAAIADTTAVVVNANATAPATSGTLSVEADETIGSLAGNGGSVVLNAILSTGAANTSTTYAGVISGEGTLTKVGTGTFTITGANTYSGGTVINGGTLEGNTVSIQGDVLANAGGTLLFTQPTDGTFAGDISGAGTVTKAGAGVLTLTGTNSGHSGTTNLNGGTVSIGAAANIGTGTLAFNGGTLLTTGALTLANAATLGANGGTVQTNAATTLSGVISGAGALTKTGTANLTLSGANTYAGGTTVAAGTVTGTTTSLQGDIVNNAAVVFDQAGGGTYAGDLSGTGTLTKTGAGAVTLSGVNTYTGATAINGGSLVAGGTGIGDTSAVTVASGASLVLGADETIGSLAGEGNLNTAAFTLTTGGNGTSTTLSGTVAGTSIVKVGAGAFTLSGTGALSGGLGVNAGSVVIAGDFASDAAVASGATLNVVTEASLTGNVATAAGGFAIVNGTVTGDVDNAGRLSGSGTVVGAVVNSGTLAPGNSPGIFTVDGSFAQTSTGTLAIELTPTAVAGTGYDQLSITGAPGTGALDGTLALAPATGLYVAGTTYDVVRADAGLTGNFAAITGNVISPFLTFTPTGVVATTGTEQVYRLTVSRTAYATGLGAGATPNQIATATGFQALVAGATGDAALLVTGVDNLTAAQAQAFFDQASPESYGAYATALQDQGELFTRQVALRMQSAGTGSSIWGRAYGQWGNGDNRAFRYGSDQDITGGVLGVDFGSEDLIVGGAIGWSKADIDYKLGNAGGDSKTWQAGAYLNYNAGSFSANLQVAYVDGDFDATRIMSAGSISRVADADFGGNLWKIVGTVGYNGVTGGLTFRPFVGIDYSNGKVDSFTETGAGAANLTVASIDADGTDLLVGIDLAGTSGGLTPYGRLTYRYELDSNDRAITALFNGAAGTAFTVSGVEPGKSQFDIDAGVSYGIGTNVSIFAGYQGTIRKDLNRHGISGGLRFGF
jgi:fibronectin-binding autotransporter adhesin